jgi:hypothetical protein
MHGAFIKGYCHGKSLPDLQRLGATHIHAICGDFRLGVVRS